MKWSIFRFLHFSGSPITVVNGPVLGLRPPLSIRLCGRDEAEEFIQDVLSPLNQMKSNMIKSLES